MKYHKIGNVLKKYAKADRSDFDQKLRKLIQSGEIKVYDSVSNRPNKADKNYVSDTESSTYNHSPHPCP